MIQVERWHATQEELQRLLATAEQHCACTTGVLAPEEPSCSPHAMLQDLRVLDYLLYVYRMRHRFQSAEWTRSSARPLARHQAEAGQPRDPLWAGRPRTCEETNRCTFVIEPTRVGN